MSMPHMDLALGTVQFGIGYGIAGASMPVPEPEVRQILKRAWELGIRTLDTATAYGNIEARLSDLIGDNPFSIVSKISAIPHALGQNAAEDFVVNAIENIRSSLGPRSTTILFHCSDDLLRENGEILWNAAKKSLNNLPIQLGVSCYSPDDLVQLSTRYSIHVAQIPGNALDQRLSSTILPEHVEVHLRSIFLQGAMLLPIDKIQQKLPQAIPAMKKWHTWCEERDMSYLQASLSIVKTLPNVRHCVVGVDQLSQLEEIAEAWSSVMPIDAPELAVNQLDIIDPRYWKNKH